MHAMPARLVFLLKAGPGSGSKIAHQAGFALYGNPPRWHQITAEKPAPKGAPVSHHPEAAGVHEPAQHFTDAQWEQLKLPDTNVNAPSYNAALAKLKDWSEAGNVTAIVGAGFGTNTYGKKLALIANQLLKMHGSVHQVEAGQKAGTHAAVAVVGDKAPKAAGTPAEQGAAAFHAGKPASPAHDAGFAAKVAGKPDAADKLNEWSSGYHAAKEAATPKPTGPLVAPEFTEGKTTTGVKALYDHTAAKIIDHGHAGNLSVLQDMVNPDKKMWQGKTPNSKKLVQLHAQALAYAAGGKVPGEAPAPKTGVPDQVKKHIDELVAGGEGDHAAALYGADSDAKPEVKAYLASKVGAKAAPPEPFQIKSAKPGNLQSEGAVHTLQAADYSGVEKALGLEPGALGDSDSTTYTVTDHKGRTFSVYKHGGALSVRTSGANKDHASAQELLDHLKAANADAGPKEGDTKPGANGGTLVLKDGHWVKQPGADDLDSPEDMAADFTKPAAPAVAPTGNLSAQHLQNLQSIPWFKLKLPDSNTNAKSHNAALAKIEAMAFAGDNAGLQAFIDAKAGAKQTYAKKQALVAQTALAALGAEGATAAVPVEPAPAPAADKVTELTPKQIEGLKGWFKAGKPTSKHPDSWSNLWSKLSPGMKAAVKAELEAEDPPAEAVPPPAAADPEPATIADGWKQAIAAGKVPTKEQADHMAAMEEKYPDAFMEEFMDAVNSLIPEETFNDDAAFDEALQAAHAKVHELHGHALNGTKPAAAAAPVTADTPLTQTQKDAVGKLSLDDMKAIIDTPLPPNVAAYIKKQIARAEKPAAPVKVKTGAKLYTNTIDGHNKFWAVSVHGSTLKTTYGKNGTKGQETVKQFPSEAAAKAAAEKLKSEKQGKGYQFVGYTEHEHDAAPGSASVEQGPKEGDTKMGADGMLVLKDGHWVKVDKDPAGDMGGWSYDPEDMAMSGAPTLNFEKEGHTVYVAKTDDGYQVGAMDADGDPLDHSDHAFLSDAVAAAAKNHGVTIPVSALKKLDPLYEAPAAQKLNATQIKAVLAGHTVPTNSHITKAKKAAAAGDAAMLQAAYSELLGTGKSMPNTKKVFMALATAMKAPLVAGASPAAAAPEPAAAAPASPAGGLPSMDGWVKTGEQQGSNAGGKFKDPSGQEWYCKFPGDADTAKSEILAAKLYALAGLSSQDAQLVTKGGKVGIATKWVNIKKAGSATALAKVEGVHQGFAVDAWLGNWDVVGMSLDNLQIGPDGKAHRVDAGGSLEYRAQGEKKPFGSKVEEIDTLRDMVKNPHAAAVFAKMTKADIAASVAKVAAISDIAIRAMVNQFGPGDDAAKKKLADTLIARKADLVSKYPQAAKPKKKPKFDPAKVSAPPSFLNWGGTGKSGPSSKAFLNQANEDAVQAIYVAAKTGDMEAVKKLTAPVYDKDSGKVTGSKPVLDHPSQHVKGYAQQAINEINYQLNPPKRFRFDGGHPLHALNHAYPPHKGATSSKVAQKLGKFLVLGDPGMVKLDDVGLPAKIKHAEGGGTLNTHTYAAAAKSAFAKMPTTQKQAVQSYTGSSYHAMNGSLWSGNPSGAAKAAGEALKTLGHDIAPGTVLSRKISVNGEDLKQLLSATGKILEEPAIMSTSIRPSSWSGNVHLKLHVGPGVKGLWVGQGSDPSGGAMSKHGGEDEMILPPNTRLLVLSSKSNGGKDADGFGGSSSHVIECIVLPTQ